MASLSVVSPQGVTVVGQLPAAATSGCTGYWVSLGHRELSGLTRAYGHGAWRDD